MWPLNQNEFDNPGLDGLKKFKTNNCWFHVESFTRGLDGYKDNLR